MVDMNEPEIDFVIPWVDGNDPEWLAEKAKYDAYAGVEAEINVEARYRDWGLMKYWFRGVEKFTPWVRKIHFLTWGHLPAFLDVDHPKIHVVKHQDFIPEDCLPIYNSSAIEVVLNRIPDLEEHFVYFNDDMFITKNMKKKDFFIDGLPCGYFEDNPFFAYGNSDYGHRLYNDLYLVNKHFNKHAQMRRNLKKWFSQPLFSKSFFYTLLSSPWAKILGIPSNHLPSAFLKSTWIRVWSKESDFLNRTLHSRFRTANSVQQDLFRYWQFAEGRFSPRRERGAYYPVSKNIINNIEKEIESPSVDFICLNDCCEDAAFEQCKMVLEKAFDNLLPKKSSFEK